MWTIMLGRSLFIEEFCNKNWLYRHQEVTTCQCADMDETIIDCHDYYDQDISVLAYDVSGVLTIF